MIRNFKHKWLEEFFHNGESRYVPSELIKRLNRKLDMLNAVNELKDLKSPPSNHLHPLHGDRQGQWAISVSGSWRLCFRFEEGEIIDLELTQYH